MYSIDRLEGAYAVLERNGAMLRLLRAELPEGIREGDMLEQSAGGWIVRRDAAEERRTALAERRRRLAEGGR